MDDLRITNREDSQPIRIGPDSTLQTETTDIVSPGVPVPVVLSDVPIYNADQVAEFLTAAGAPSIADALSDATCGPQDLPQLVAPLAFNAPLPGADPVDVQPTFEGQVALIPYSNDRILRLDQLSIDTGGTVLFLTVAALLTRG